MADNTTSSVTGIHATDAGIERTLTILVDAHRIWAWSWGRVDVGVERRGGHRYGHLGLLVYLGIGGCHCCSGLRDESVVVDGKRNVTQVPG